jgi:hypothetical protein
MCSTFASNSVALILDGKNLHLMWDSSKHSFDVGLKEKHSFDVGLNRNKTHCPVLLDYD